MKKHRDQDLHHQVLSFIEKFVREERRSPTDTEIATGCNRKAKSQICAILHELREAGLVDFPDGAHRSIRITRKGYTLLHGQPVYNAVYVNQAAKINGSKTDRPLPIPILGRTFGGPFNMSFPTEHAAPEDYLFVGPAMLPMNIKGDDLFALEIQGDSMKGANINDGDTVIFQRAETANNGDMVAIWIEDVNGTTLKYFYKEDGQIRLQPANDEVDPIIVKGDVGLRVQGKAICVVRADQPFLL